MQFSEPSVEDNKISEKILDAAFIVHRELGPGLLESIYEVCMLDVLQDMGMNVQRQHPFSVQFRGKTLETGFRADLIVNESVLVELKSVDRLMPVYDAQVLTYLKMSGLSLGLLVNFNVPMLKQGIKRLVFSQSRGDRSVRCG